MATNIEWRRDGRQYGVPIWKSKIGVVSADSAGSWYFYSHFTPTVTGPFATADDAKRAAEAKSPNGG